MQSYKKVAGETKTQKKSPREDQQSCNNNSNINCCCDGPILITLMCNARFSFDF